MKPAILDTGPLVAWFCPRDQHHAWARKVFRELSPGSILCEAVLTEVCHLVVREGITPGKVIDSLNRGHFQNVALGSELIPIARLLHAYADTPMDFADACVVRLAELHPDAAVCTTDTDFLVFRKYTTEPLSLNAPFTP